MESEIIALSEKIKELKWVVNILSKREEWNYIKIPIVIKTDSMSTIEWIKNRGAKAGGTRHLTKKLYFIKKDVELGNYIIKHEPTDSIESDGLTKTLGLQKIKNCFGKFLTFEGGI